MAIIQISRIQHRRGRLDDLKKTYLSAAEFGWAMDKRRLFIGNGELAEGASERGNTEILTEYSPHMDLIAYKQGNRFVDVTGQMTPMINQAWQRSIRLQEKLDDHIDIRGYDVRGDNQSTTGGINAETLNIRRAVYDVSLRPSFTQMSYPNLSSLPSAYESYGPWKAIYWPSGVYVINRPLPLLSHTTWIGDGMGSTIIVMRNPAEPIDNYVLGSSYYNLFSGQMSFDDYPDDSYLIDDGNSFVFAPFATNPMGGSFGWPIENITVKGISFVNETDGDICRLGNCRNVTFIDCEFTGTDYDCSQDPYNTPFSDNGPDQPTNNSSTLSKCVTISGINAGAGTILSDDDEFTYKTRNIAFLDCKFSKRGYGIQTDDEIVQVYVGQSEFSNLYDGVNLGEDLTLLGNPVTDSRGPKNFQVHSSTFDKIRRFGFAVFSLGNFPPDEQYLGSNGSMYNHYDMVGFPLDADCTGSSSDYCDWQYPAVYFHNTINVNGLTNGAVGNFSIADSFSRPNLTAAECSGLTFPVPQISNTNKQNVIISYGAQDLPGPVVIDGLTLTGIVKGNLIDSSPAGTLITDANTASIITFDLDEVDSIIVDYSIKRPNTNSWRIGTIRVIKANGVLTGPGNEFAFDDDYQELNGPVGFELSWFHDTSNPDRFHLTYEDLSPGGGNGELNFSTRQWLTNT